MLIPIIPPLYKKVINIEKDKLEDEKVKNIGKVEIPKAKKSEYVRIIVLDQGGKELEKYRLKKRSYKLYIQREKGDVLFTGFLSNLDMMKRKSAGDGAKLRLPSGRYKAWWRGYKKKNIVTFKISQKEQPVLKIKLPDE